MFGPFQDATVTSQIKDVVGGSVYALEVDGAVKVGCSRRPSFRIRDLAMGFHRDGKETGKYICSPVVKGAFYLEKRVHENLSHVAVDGAGELFLVSLSDVCDLIRDIIDGGFHVIHGTKYEVPEWSQEVLAMPTPERYKIAQAMGITERTLYNWASGRSTPRKFLAKDVMRRLKARTA